MKKIIIIMLCMILIVIISGCNIKEEINEINLNDSIGFGEPTEWYIVLKCDNQKVVLDYKDYQVNTTMKDICDKIK